MTLGLFNVFGPFLVIVDRVHTQANDLAIALIKLRLQPRHVAELGGAHGREVLGMGEQNGPTVADPFMKINLAFCGVRREIGCLIADA